MFNFIKIAFPLVQPKLLGLEGFLNMKTSKL